MINYQIYGIVYSLSHTCVFLVNLIVFILTVALII